MRNLILIGVGFLFTLNSCQKNKKHEMIVIKNCTGDYLEGSEKTYKVCNTETLSNFIYGESVVVEYDIIEDCNYSYPDSAIFCELGYYFDNYINVTSVE